MELRQLLSIMWRRKWIGITVFLSFFLVIVGTSLLVTPTFDSTAKIMLRPSKSAHSLMDTLDLPSGVASDSTLSTTVRSTLIALATVKPVAEKVANDLKLQRERVRAKIIKAIPFAPELLKMQGVDITKMVKPVSGEDLLNKSLLSAIFPRPYVSVEQYEETNIVEIKAVSPDPQQARDIADAMANAYMEMEKQILVRDFNEVTDILEQNLASVLRDYDRALEEAEAFKIRENLVTMDTEISTIIDRIVELKTSSETIQINTDRAVASLEDAKRQLKTMPRFRKSSEQLSRNDVINNAKTSLQTFFLELAASRTRYRSDHPDIIDIHNQIDYLKSIIKEETLKVFDSETLSVDPVYQSLTTEVAGYYTSIAANEAQKKALNQLLIEYEEKLSSLPPRITENTRLEMDLGISSNLAQSMMSYARRIELAKAVSLSNIMMVAPPEVPQKTDNRHSHPNHMINIIVAVFLGTFFGFVSMLVVEYVDDTIHSPKDLKYLEKVNLLGCITKVRTFGKVARPTVQNTPGLRDYFKRIHMEMEFFNTDNNPRRLAVTSLFENEGKRFFSVSHGIIKASQGMKVLIIDTDVEHPGLHKWFDMENSNGLAQYLNGKSSLSEIIQPSGISGLSLITAGCVAEKAQTDFSTNKLHEAVRGIEQFYDLIILVSPPAMKDIDVFAQLADQDEVIVIVESGRVRKVYFEEFLSLVNRAGVSLMGTVLNRQPGIRYHYARYDLNPLEVFRHFFRSRFKF